MRITELETEREVSVNGEGGNYQLGEFDVHFDGGDLWIYLRNPRTLLLRVLGNKSTSGGIQIHRLNYIAHNIGVKLNLAGKIADTYPSGVS